MRQVDPLYGLLAALLLPFRNGEPPNAAWPIEWSLSIATGSYRGERTHWIKGEKEEASRGESRAVSAIR